jgi:hypothetical protein
MSYSSTILADTPLFYYRMDQTSGNFTDSSGHGYTGTVTGTPTYSQTGALSGDSDTCAKFPGSAYVTVASGATVSTAVTLECWIKSSGTISAYNRFLDNGYPINDHKGIEVMVAPPADGSMGYVNLGLGTSYTGTNFGTGVFVTNTWYYLVVTYDGTTLKIYLNGSLNTSMTQTGCNVANVTNFHIASDSSGSQDFAGWLDEVAVYSYALSSSQVTTHYNAGISTTATTTTTTTNAVTETATLKPIVTQTDTIAVTETVTTAPISLGTVTDVSTSTESASLLDIVSLTETTTSTDTQTTKPIVSISTLNNLSESVTAAGVAATSSSSPTAQMLYDDLQIQYYRLIHSIIAPQLQLIALVYYASSTLIRSVPGELDVLLVNENISQLHVLNTINDVTTFLETYMIGNQATPSYDSSGNYSGPTITDTQVQALIFSGQAFSLGMPSTSVSSTGNYGIQIWNPAASGKTLLVYSMQFIGTSTTVSTLTTYNAQQNPTTPTNMSATNLYLNNATSFVGTANFATAAWTPSGTVLQTAIGTGEIFNAGSYVIIPPGYGLFAYASVTSGSSYSVMARCLQF